MRHRSTLLAAVAAALLALPTPAFALGTLDQSQADMGAALVITNTGVVRPFGQTFTAGQTGALDTVALHPFFSLAGAVLQVRSASGNLPTSTVLASQAVLSSDTEGFVYTSFTEPAVVAAGTQYAIVVVPASSAMQAVAASTGDAYAGGRAVAVEPDGVTWSGLSQDLVFETYVTPQTPNGDDGGDSGDDSDGDEPKCQGLANARAKVTGRDGGHRARGADALRRVMTNRGCTP